MTLREKRVKFSRLLAEIVNWAFSQGWEVAFDEVRVFSPRKVFVDGRTRIADDRVHKVNSFHHSGLAADLLLYVNGTWLSKGSEPEWIKLGEKWESLDGECTWGGRFNDPNHFSLGEH